MKLIGQLQSPGQKPLDVQLFVSNLQSGTYIPTLTNNTNVAASTAFLCQWIQVGSVVTVSGRVNIDPTAAGTLTILLMSLPVAATIGASESCSGCAVSDSQIGDAAAVRGATSTNEARFDWFPTVITNTGFAFTFMYSL